MKKYNKYKIFCVGKNNDVLSITHPNEEELKNFQILRFLSTKKGLNLKKIFFLKEQILIFPDGAINAKDYGENKHLLNITFLNTEKN
jgi:hypothetical protein